MPVKMLTMALAAGATVALVCLTLPPAARACSVVRHYLPPTNYELVKDTPAIVLARAVGATRGRHGLEKIRFLILRSLKGPLKLRTHLQISGTTRHYFGRSPRGDFSRARPGALRGGCTAYDYKGGAHYLLFLKKFHGAWQAMGQPFTRINEEVSPAGSPWVKAVTQYVRIGRLGDYAKEKRALLRLLRQAQAGRGGSALYCRALAKDLERHFKAMTPAKSFADLKALYGQAKTRFEKWRGLVAIAQTYDRAALPFMTRLLAAGATDNQVHALALYFRKVPATPATINNLATLYVRLGQAKKQTRWPLMWTLVIRAGKANQAAMLRVLRSADSEEAGRLAQWFAAFPSKAAERELLRRHAAASQDDKRNLTLALASQGTRKIIAWAEQRLRQPRPKRRDVERRLAAFAIARCVKPQCDRVARQIIARGGDDLLNFIHGLVNARHSRVKQRLRQIAARRGLSVKARQWVKQVVDARARCRTQYPLSCMD